jgi:hypothetical protein
MNKIHRPGQVVMQGLYQRVLNSQGKPLFVLTAKVESHFSIDSVDAFMIVVKVHCSESAVHHPEAPRTVQVCHLPQLLPDRLIIGWLCFVVSDGGVSPYQFAGPTKTDCMLFC